MKLAITGGRMRARGALTAIAVASALMIGGCGETDLGGAPDVTGLALDTANAELEKAGFSSSVTDDAMFGVIVESHFTVCEQDTPKGMLVPLEVSKQC